MSQIEEIKKLHQDGQYQDAINGYQDLLKQEPNNDEAHFGLAHALSRTQDLEQALNHVSEAVKLVPNSDRYQQFKGQMLMANGRLDDALKAFKRSIKENPNLFFSYLAVGDIHAIKNEPKKAKSQYELALKVHTDGIPAITKMARLLMIEGDLDGAESLLQQAELQYPAEPNVKLHMGMLRLEQGADGFAELYFKKLLEDDPNNHVAKACLSISLLRSDPEQAGELLAELINQQVRIPELMAAMGMWYTQTQNFQEAIRYLTPVCQSGLAYPNWLLTLAQALVGNRQPNSAQAILDEVLKRGNNSKAWLMLGQIHQVNGNYPSAIKTYQKVAADDQHHTQAQLLQAECHYAAGDHPACIQQLDTILAQRADHNSALKLKLNALSQLGQMDQALALIDSVDAAQQTPSFNQLMHLYAGMLLDEQGAYEAAWDHFAELEHNPAPTIQMLSPEEEKAVQNWPTTEANSVFRFVFTDPATGHHDFMNWLMDNDITPLIDRFTSQSRTDVFAQAWTIPMLQELNEGQLHLWRKKYTKQLNLALKDDPEMVVDFLPFSPLNAAIIKRVFPQAHVLVLSRNIADLRLHSQVFGSHQVHYTDFAKVVNQMIAMNPNVALVDIDAWQAKDPTAVEHMQRIFGPGAKPFKTADVTPLDRLMFPHMHWKHYQQQLNSSH
ncbi:tetratricopeptide repeat protein [Marinicella meishanensis]|uniref:tetratricopeptide repeat protein n=1 Tax=Marinicella meishanensis TaxID=2873263 RepID=UPI001CBA81EB|nr:tetratricopeptide repeat protein [Marinicella sp. NBU2979]